MSKDPFLRNAILAQLPEDEYAQLGLACGWSRPR